MTIMRNVAYLSIAAYFFVVAAHAFLPGGGRKQLTLIAEKNGMHCRKSSSSSLLAAGGSGGPLDSLFAFLKGGKVGLVKSLAGEYDAIAVRSKIDSLVKKNSVLMFSFTTCPYCIKGERGSSFSWRF